MELPSFFPVARCIAANTESLQDLTEPASAEIDVVYRCTRGRYQHLVPPSKVARVNRFRFSGYVLRRPADRLVQRVLRSLSGSSSKKPPGRKRNSGLR
ncbi:hypothetical protein RB195_010913 [Necator americanus]|uniref:Uncharacterized protein n=1 Tax=Necator americanus TaxID=51031 RepID=A0ABR1D011_NECAM